MSRQNAALKDTIDDQADKITKLTNDLKSERLKDQSAVNGENAEIARLNQEIEQKKSILDDTKKRLDALRGSPNETMGSVEAELKREKEVIQDYDKKLKVMQQEKNELESTHKNESGNFQATLKSRNQELDLQIKSQQASIKDLNSQLTQAKKDKYNSDSKDLASQLTRQIDDQRKFIGKLEEEKHIMNMQADNNKSVAELQHHGDVTELDDSIKQLKDRLNTEKANASSLEAKVQQNRMSQADQKQRLRQLDLDFQSQQAQLTELQRQLGVHQAHLKEISQ